MCNSHKTQSQNLRVRYHLKNCHSLENNTKMDLGVSLDTSGVGKD
jgi:hypothetical protein